MVNTKFIFFDWSQWFVTPLTKNWKSNIVVFFLEEERRFFDNNSIWEYNIFGAAESANWGYLWRIKTRIKGVRRFRWLPPVFRLLLKRKAFSISTSLYQKKNVFFFKGGGNFIYSEVGHGNQFSYLIFLSIYFQFIVMVLTLSLNV